MLKADAARLDRAQRYARERPPGRLYAVVRALASGLLRLWFRIDVTGIEQLPEDRGVILAAYHKSFLGAFPVRRGEGDAAALMTARSILADRGLIVVFPEGTRVDEPDALGSPHHGAGRLAIESGAPIVPVAILGTSHLWLGPVPKPRRVDVSFLPPVEPDTGEGMADIRATLKD